MVRPIESNMSLYNVELKASEIKDPNASQFQAAQQTQSKKDMEHKAQSVQATEELEGEVKIRDKDSKRERDGDGKKKKKDGRPGEQQEDVPADRKPDTSRGFSFLA